VKRAPQSVRRDKGVPDGGHLTTYYLREGDPTPRLDRPARARANKPPASIWKV
jgi:hypothetical protein